MVAQTLLHRSYHARSVGCFGGSLCSSVHNPCSAASKMRVCQGLRTQMGVSETSWAFPGCLDAKMIVTRAFPSRYTRDATKFRCRHSGRDLQFRPVRSFTDRYTRRSSRYDDRKWILHQMIELKDSDGNSPRGAREVQVFQRSSVN